MTVLDRLLKYVAVYTTSDTESSTTPSSARQFDLAKMLKAELDELGLEKVVLTDTGYVYGLLPASEGFEGKKAVGLIAHMDTAPDFSGENVKPQVIEDYDGEDVLLAGSNEYLKVSDFPELASLKGRTLITTDGTTLLGADDKAGIAVILTAVEKIINEGLPHADIWVGFTPDEEIGEGADHFDLDYFKADFAYTVDGGYEGEISFENFNAAAAIFSVKGVSVHPGEAKDLMVNAGLIAAEIAMMMPADQVPAKTELREGFIHLTDMKGNVESASLQYILRDHDKQLFADKKALMLEITDKMNAKYGEGTVSVEIIEQYENMQNIIEENMYIVELANDAIRSQGIEPMSEPVRGGTDGARLSFMGLPCPNLGAGGYGFHGPFEHCTKEGMEIAVNICTYIAANSPDK